MIDGANGVTTDPRAHFPQAGMWLALAVIVVVLVRVVKRPAIIAVALAVAAVPGFVHVLALRADAPLQRPALTSAIATTLGDLQQRTPWPGRQVKVVKEEDDVLFPLGRYALPSRPEVNGPAIELELGAGPLGAACRQQEARVTCGVTP